MSNVFLFHLVLLLAPLFSPGPVDPGLRPDAGLEGREASVAAIALDVQSTSVTPVVNLANGYALDATLLYPRESSQTQLPNKSANWTRVLRGDSSKKHDLITSHDHHFPQRYRSGQINLIERSGSLTACRPCGQEVQIVSGDSDGYGVPDQTEV